MPLQYVQQVDAGHLRPVTMEDDDIGIADSIRGTGQRGDCLHGKALLGQLVGQESATDRVVLDEKDANCVRFADGAEWHRCARIQTHRT